MLSDEEFARRVKPRSAAEMEADASFKLAVWFQQAGNAAGREYFERAQTLNPDDWNYHRQEWSFTPATPAEVAGEVQEEGRRYYPKLEMKKKGGEQSQSAASVRLSTADRRLFTTSS